MPITLTNDFAEVSLGPVTLSNNTWGIDTWGFDHWVNGKDYTQTLTYTPGNLTHDVRFDWSYSNAGGNILAYPELILGFKPWSLTGDPFLVGRIDRLRDLTLSVDVDIRGQTNGFNIAFDLWLTDVAQGGPETITAEVMVWLHPGGFNPAGQPAARLITDGLSASVYFQPDMSAGTDLSWAYIAVIIDGGRLDGAVDMNLILQFLADRGFIDRGDFLSSVEIGAEVQTGSGGFTLNSFDWQHSTYAVTDGADRLAGTARRDVIDAGAGNDTLIGHAGDDRLTGAVGDDRLVSGAGADRLFGGAGRDSLSGGVGADILTGGGGADLFQFGSLAEVAGDHITDFRSHQRDRIDLRRLDANASTPGDDAFAFIGAGAFSGIAGQLRVETLGITTMISGDINGNRLADFTLLLQGQVTLGALDFLL